MCWINLTCQTVIPFQISHTAAAFTAIDILKPAVAELVSLTRGQFDLEEILASDFSELMGCRLGNLQEEQLHIIAVAKGAKFLATTSRSMLIPS